MTPRTQMANCIGCESLYIGMQRRRSVESSLLSPPPPSTAVAVVVVFVVVAAVVVVVLFPLFNWLARSCDAKGKRMEMEPLEVK